MEDVFLSLRGKLFRGLGECFQVYTNNKRCDLDTINQTRSRYPEEVEDDPEQQ